MKNQILNQPAQKIPNPGEKTQLVARMPRAEKEAFLAAAKRNDISASRLIRSFVRKYLSDQAFTSPDQQKR